MSFSRSWTILVNLALQMSNERAKGATACPLLPRAASATPIILRFFNEIQVKSPYSFY
jgi:hypothetical protein